MKYKMTKKSDMPFDKLHEECGVFGIYGAKDDNISAAHEIHTALFALQHRGQEACGIAVNNKGIIKCHKDIGLVTDVFKESTVNSLEGNIGIGHCRYSTMGVQVRENAQPIAITHIKGNMAVVHNGALTNSFELRREYELAGGIFRSTTDTEVLAHTIVKERVKCSSIEEAVQNAMKRLEGSYSIIVMSPRKMIAARDPHGFRPLCIGKLKNSYIFSSETCALDALDAEFVRDVEPGEIVIVEDGELRSFHCGIEAESSLCVFEHIYFARPDSVIDGVSVEMARQEAGKFLALEHAVGADVVIGVPDSGIPAAIGYSKTSGIPYGVGFIKNRYIARTFIQPGQAKRERSVKIKLNALKEAVRGKRVVMVDDSIVRGTTCARIVRLLRDAGATEVHVRSSAPAFLYPCYFGTDVPDQNDLIAVGRTEQEIADIIGADSVGYLSTSAVNKIARGSKVGFCNGCFTGKYPASIPTTHEKNIFERGLDE